MNKDEGNRLAAVEVKIDGLSDKIDALEKSFIDKISDQEKAFNITQIGQKEAINIAMVASEKAIVKSEIATDLRFNDVEKRFTDYVEGINASIKILTENKDINVGAKTGATEQKTSAKDVILYILFAITAISFIISMYVK